MEIEEGEARLEQLRDTGVQLRQEFDPRLVGPGEELAEPGRRDELAERAANPPAEVVRAAEQIGSISAAEMIDPRADPR